MSFGNAFAQHTKQDSSKTHYLLHGKNVKIHQVGIYIAPEILYGNLAGGFTPMAGSTGMLLINKKFGMGLSAYSTMGNYTPTVLSSSKNLHLNSNFGGIKLEYTPNPNALVHLTFSLMGGVGSARIDSSNRNQNFGGNHDNFDRNDSFGGRGKDFAVFQPGVNLETNLFRYAKLFAGLSYRITSGASATAFGSSSSILTNKDFQGLNASVGLKFGLFDYQIHAKRKHKMNHKNS